MKCNYCGNTKGEYLHFEGADYPVGSLKCGRALFGKDFCKESKKKEGEKKWVGKK